MQEVGAKIEEDGPSLPAAFISPSDSTEIGSELGIGVLVEVAGLTRVVWVGAVVDVGAVIEVLEIAALVEELAGLLE